MDSRQDQMARLRGFDRNVCSLKIPDFAHHDDVRILAKERLQCRGKRQSGFFINIDLVHSRQVDF